MLPWNLALFTGFSAAEANEVRLSPLFPESRHLSAIFFPTDSLLAEFSAKFRQDSKTDGQAA